MHPSLLNHRCLLTAETALGIILSDDDKKLTDAERALVTQALSIIAMLLEAEEDSFLEF